MLAQRDDDVKLRTFLGTFEPSHFHAFQLIDAELEPNGVSNDRAVRVRHHRYARRADAQVYSYYSVFHHHSP